MSAMCDVLDPVDVWLNDPDLLRSEFEALIAENFAPEPPGRGPGPTPPPDRPVPERDEGRTLRSWSTGTAPAGLRAARERGPPTAG
jgi:hypothetical protein